MHAAGLVCSRNDVTAMNAAKDATADLAKVAHVVSKRQNAQRRCRCGSDRRVLQVLSPRRTFTLRHPESLEDRLLSGVSETTLLLSSRFQGLFACATHLDRALDSSLRQVDIADALLTMHNMGTHVLMASSPCVGPRRRCFCPSRICTRGSCAPCPTGLRVIGRRHSLCPFCLGCLRKAIAAGYGLSCSPPFHWGSFDFLLEQPSPQRFSARFMELHTGRFLVHTRHILSHQSQQAGGPLWSPERGFL